MDKKLITQKDIEEMLKSNKKILSISSNVIITPLAMDLIKKEGVKLDYYHETILSSNEYDSLKLKEKTYDINNFPSELVLKFYYYMLKIRLFEELVKTYKEKKIIPGIMVHSYIGQEAIAVGVCIALGKGDFLTSTHRGHGHLIAKGADIGKMLAEILGKADGYCRGKGGSMHITDIGLGILGANGIVGAGLPIACGSAMASKFNGESSITVSFFGDGAANQGTFGESLNFAKIFSLPVLFLCENNGYAVSTKVSYSCGSTPIYKRGLGFEICSELINGDDVFEVYSVCKKHIDNMRMNPNPVLIEALTHRQIGHWVGDSQKYRTLEEIESLPKYDPLRIFRNRIGIRSDISRENLEEIESKVINEIKDAAIFADNSPYAPLEEAIKDYIKE